MIQERTGLVTGAFAQCARSSRPWSRPVRYGADMTVEFVRVEVGSDNARLVEFLCAHEWPFHGRSRLSADDVDAMEFATADVASWWIRDGGEPVGLVRVLDLGDIGVGAPLLDLRVATPHRGGGVGTIATRWLTDHLFSTYPEMHRFEANTSEHNVAMQRVLERVGYRLEGRLREAWLTADGDRPDALLYGILRRDWEVATVSHA